MKNLMVYISSTNSFNNPQPGLINDSEPLVKVQIENSLSLGWKPKDITLITNFPFNYGVIKAKTIPDIEFFVKKPQASKINAIIKLFEKKLIKKDELYWFHDIDAFQLEPIPESEINLGPKEILVTNYGRSKRWSTGSIFFRNDTEDIFRKIKRVVYQKEIDEERALGILTNEDTNIQKRVKLMNRSYNFTPMNLKASYRRALKPIRVAHIHPQAENKQANVKNPLDYFRGNNYINTPILTRRLVKIFKYHGIT